jgi:hypothetical protein
MTRWHWIELLALTCLAAGMAAGSILSEGHWAWSWDALNHHIYLGLISESLRWDLDVAAASVQTYQYPYLYWPVYRISLLPITGAQAGMLWAVFQVLMVVPPVWLCSFHLLPSDGRTAQAIFERSAACALALSSIVVMAAIGTTSNDLMAAVPLLWAVALMAAPRTSDRRAGAAAALWGISTAFKWSNGLAIPLLLFWWWQSEPSRSRLNRAGCLAFGAVAGYAVTYAPWGWQLWHVTGNPFYPFFGSWFGG